jgi:MarR family transcriptional regulator, negative regulator of the multidrug operon emrRAB
MHDRSERVANLAGAWALHVADAVREVTEAEAELGGGAPAALVTIQAVPGRPMEAIRALLGLSQPGALRLVERLERAGLIERRPGRPAGLALTAAGDATVERMLARRQARLKELLAPLEPAERDALEGALGKLLAAATGDRLDLDRLCRLCARPVCERCPVAGTLRG